MPSFFLSGRVCDRRLLGPFSEQAPYEINPLDRSLLPVAARDETQIFMAITAFLPYISWVCEQFVLERIRTRGIASCAPSPIWVQM
jgi:hypothetical protein